MYTPRKTRHVEHVRVPAPRAAAAPWQACLDRPDEAEVRSALERKLIELFIAALEANSTSAWASFGEALLTLPVERLHEPGADGLALALRHYLTRTFSAVQGAECERFIVDVLADKFPREVAKLQTLTLQSTAVAAGDALAGHARELAAARTPRPLLSAGKRSSRRPVAPPVVPPLRLDAVPQASGGGATDPRALFAFDVADVYAYDVASMREATALGSAVSERFRRVNAPAPAAVEQALAHASAQAVLAPVPPATPVSASPRIRPLSAAPSSRQANIARSLVGLVERQGAANATGLARAPSSQATALRGDGVSDAQQQQHLPGDGADPLLAMLRAAQTTVAVDSAKPPEPLDALRTITALPESVRSLRKALAHYQDSPFTLLGTPAALAAQPRAALVRERETEAVLESIGWSAAHDGSPPQPPSHRMPEPAVPLLLASAAAASAAAAAAADDDDDAGDTDERTQHLHQCTTALEAVRYFARSWPGDPVKFIYFNRAKTGLAYRPYELVVCERVDAEPVHFTMSQTGVVLFQPGMPTEYYPLGEFVRLASIFNMVVRIPFFRNYIKDKALGRWRANVRFKLFRDTRAVVAKRLFIARPAFQATLLRAQELCTEIWRAPLVELVPRTLYSFRDFAERQSAAQALATDMFKGVSVSLEQLILALCDEVLRRTQWCDDGPAPAGAAVSNGSTNGGGGGTVVAGPGAPPPNALAEGGGRLKSMAQERAEYLAKLAAIASAAEEARLLGKVIRLVDLMSVEALVHNVEVSLRLLLAAMREPGEDGLFKVDVRFSVAAGMSLDPPLDAVLTRYLGDARLRMFAVCTSFLRVITMRSLRAFMEPATTQQLEDEAVAAFDAPARERMLKSVGQLVDEENEAVCALISAIDGEMRDVFGRALRDAGVLLPLLDVYQFAASWNVASFAASNPDLATLRSTISRVTQWLTDTARMRKAAIVGLLLVDSAGLKRELVPMPVTILAELKMLLAQEAKRACTAAIARLSETHSRLVQTPDAIKGFAEFVEFVNGVVESREALDREAATVDGLYELMVANDVDVDIANRMLIEELGGLRAGLEPVLLDAQRFADVHMADMRTTLDRHISTMETHVLGTLGELYSGIFVDPTCAPTAVLVKLSEVARTLRSYETKATTYAHWQELFRVEHKHEYRSLNEAMSVHAMRTTIWTSLESWNSAVQTWRTSQFRSLDMEAVRTTILNSYAAAYKMAHRLTDDPVVLLWKASVDEFKRFLPLLMALGNPALRDRHWARIFGAMGQPYAEGAKFTLNNLVALDVFAHRAFIEEISSAASGEYHLEQTLARIKAAWSTARFAVLPFKKKGKLVRKVHVLGSVADITAMLDEHSLMLSTIQGSRFVAGIRSDVELWVTNLGRLRHLLDVWLQLQRNWLYLEAIFVQKDIQMQLPEETKTFQSVHELWVRFMQSVAANPVVLDLLGDAANTIEICKHANRHCEEVRRALELYLETKRVAFPRFYFLSNEELLGILAHIREPTAVTPHLKKCFAGIVALKFSASSASGPAAERALDDQSLSVLAMQSAEDEEVSLLEAVSAAGNVEVWLSRVETAMRLALADNTARALHLAAEDVPATQLLMRFPAQAVLTASMVFWTAGVEAAIRRESHPTNPQQGALRHFLSTFTMELESLVSLARQTNLAPLVRTALGALIVLDVHARDVIRACLDAGVSSVDDFAWQKQLRYYADGPGATSVTVRQTVASFAYQHEYLGNNPRLVITPLTERCYLTLTTALHMSMGGAPMGPAGTGKTETTKDLAKALGQLCVVFNCSDGLEVPVMARFFSGLAQAGAWACFDEFNRIDIEVLSVIAQQVLCIQQALISRVEQFDFDGRTIRLNSSYGCFVTMNPGYAGRTELPDNLMALLRPVSMMIPDYAMIAEIILFSEGFSAATALSSKIVTLYKLASEQLSQQDHYDFGLRALKSVLVMAGELKRRAAREGEISEDVVLIRAIRDANVPKFLAEDVPLFLAIVQDLFPGVAAPEQRSVRLEDAAASVLVARGLVPVPTLVRKVVQLYETLSVRHGVMLVGASGTGKSTVYRTLAAAQTRIRLDGATDVPGVLTVTLNPKTIELYGSFEAASTAWTDGLVASVVREILAVEAGASISATAAECGRTQPYFAAPTADAPEDFVSSAAKWLVFDGPVDSGWIEDMNTVLDDNRMLCLASGERIKLPGSVRMIFEVADLAVASPATVSRCGMVFLEEVHLSWRVLVPSWAARAVREGRISSAESDWLVPLLGEVLLPRLFAHAEHFGSTAGPGGSAGAGSGEAASEYHQSSRMGSVASTLALLQALLAAPRAPDVSVGTGGSDALRLDLLAPSLVFACVWGLGGNYVGAAREAFDAYVRSAGAGFRAVLAGACGEACVALFDAFSVYDWFVDVGLVPVARGSEVRPSAAEQAAAVLSEDARAASAAELAASTGGAGNSLAAGSSEAAASVTDSAAAAGALPARRAVRLALWSSLVGTAPFVFVPRASFHDMYVHTPVTVCYAVLVELMLDGGRSVVLSGGSGVGKTMLIGEVLRRKCADGKVVAAQVCFSAATSATTLQTVLEAKLTRHSATRLGAPLGARQLVFIDNLSMPRVEKWGAAPPLELVRQALDAGGMYDRKRLQWVELAGTQLLGALAPPGGGSYRVSPRLLRQFGMLAIPELSAAAAESIFEPLLASFLRSYTSLATGMAGALVSATVALFMAVRARLLPTPSRSHYTFNVRHVGQVVQGVLQLGQLGSLPTLALLARLWQHECARVFRDRLVSSGEAAWFDGTLASLTEAHLGPSLALGAEIDTLVISTHLRFKAPAYYSELSDASETVARLNEYQQERNVVRPREEPLELVFFPSAVRHVARILRVLRQPRGSMLLLGPAGTGRRSLTRLAAHLADFALEQLVVGDKYGPSEFRDDVRRVCDRAGRGQHVVFLLMDTQLVSEAFCDDISNLLNSGEVPQLYGEDEQAALVTSLLADAKAAGVDASRDSVLGFFRERVRAHLHVVLCMSPVGEVFRSRIRAFPAFVNCCTVDWFDAWPEDALRLVAESKLSAMLGGHNFVSGAAPALKPLADVCVAMFRSVDGALAKLAKELRRRSYVTPSSFLELLALFDGLLRGQLERVNGRMAHLSNGLAMLAKFNELVRTMQDELRLMQPVLELAAQEAAQILAQVAKDQAMADEVQAHVKAEEVEVETTTRQMQQLRDSAMAAVESVMPTYNAAIAALGALNRDDLAEVRNYPRPPPAVEMVMDAVCLLLGEKPGWEAAKRLMAAPGFIATLEKFDRDNISADTLRKLDRFVLNPDFAPDIVGKTSVAARSLCLWVRAISNYGVVYQDVKPKKEQLAAAEERFGAIMRLLADKRRTLGEVQARVAELQGRYEAALARQKQVEQRIGETEKRLGRASKLVSGLGSEAARWRELLDKLADEQAHVVGDALMGAGCVAFLGIFPPDYRARLTSSWLVQLGERGLAASSGFAFAESLSDAVTVRQWHAEGLPADSFSVENALIATLSRKACLFVDPQGQAGAWLRMHERENGLVVVDVSDATLVRVLQSAVPVGAPVLLEGLGESLPALLEPLLARRGGGSGAGTVRVGEAEVYCHADFRLFLSTKLANPHFLPEVVVSTSVIHFAVTRLNLEDQLLGTVVRIERPELERQKSDLVLQLSSDADALVALQERILQLVSTASSAVLDDDALIDTFQASAATSEAIKTRLAAARETRATIDSVRAQYLPVAVRGTVLYFVLCDLGGLDVMYQFSLAFFAKLFAKCIASMPAGGEISERLISICSAVTLATWQAVSRGLFRAHRRLFALMMTLQVMRAEGEIPAEAWSALLQSSALGEQAASAASASGGASGASGGNTSSGGVSGDAGGQVPGEGEILSCPDWLSAQSWSGAGLLESVHGSVFAGLRLSLASTDALGAAWREWHGRARCEDEALPGRFGLVGPFDRLLAIRVLREDRFVLAAESLVRLRLGGAFVSVSGLSLDSVWADSAPDVPIVIILSPGADPMLALMDLAARAGFASRLKLVSLGQNQGASADAAIAGGLRHGGWVMLQNCHLGGSYMPTLDRLVAGLGSRREEIHPDFRLWLSSASSALFPANILRAGLKYTNEPPDGVRANLQRIYSRLTASTFELDGTDHTNHADGSSSIAAYPPFSGQLWKKLLYGLAFFHAVALERRRFGAIGFNVSYGWTDADLHVSTTMLRSMLSETNAIRWEALRVMVADIHYGGRITDLWDSRTVRSLLDGFVNARLVEPELRALAQSSALSLSSSSAGGLAGDELLGPAAELVPGHAAYRVPLESSLAGWRRAFDVLPEHEPAELFGLHANAELGFRRADSASLVASLVETQPRSDVSAGVAAEDVVLGLAESLLKRLPRQLVLAQAHASTFALTRDGRINSLGTVLRQEVERFNRLLGIVEESLVSLMRGLRGEVVMSPVLEEMLDAMLLKRVPAVWVSASYASLKPLGSWLSDLIARVDFMRGWLVGGPPASFWLPGFFFPQGFLTGVMQAHARAHAIAIDALCFRTHVTEMLTPGAASLVRAPEAGVLIHGLYIEGGAWANGQLCEARTGVLADALPLVWLEPAVLPASASARGGGGVDERARQALYGADARLYTAPLYATSARAGVLSTTGRSTNYILSLDLPFDGAKFSEDHFVRRGTALVCQP